MRVLVTGHHGYIGSVMVNILRGAGHHVTGWDTDYYADCTFGQPDAHIEGLRKDIRDVHRDDLQGIDAVIHLAALSNDPVGNLKPEWTDEINYRASVSLAQAAKEAGVQCFVFSSSCSIYGAGGQSAQTEDAPLDPLTPYAVSKVRAEEAIARLADQHFSPVFLRNATVYGVSPRLRVDLVLNNLVGWAYLTGKVRIMSDGTPWRPLVHVEDLCRVFAAMLAAPRPRIHNQAFNVGVNGENYQVRDLASIVQRTVPRCVIEYTEEASADPRNYRVDFSKLACLIPAGTFRWNASRGAQELYAAFQGVGLTLQDFQGYPYTRLKQLQRLISTNRLDETLRWVGTRPDGKDPARLFTTAESRATLKSG